MTQLDRSLYEQPAALPLPLPDDELQLHDVFAIVADSKWMIVAIMATAILGGALSIIFGPPVYDSDALIQVDRKEGAGILADLYGPLTGESPVTSEIEILRSRTLLGVVIDELHLHIEASPRYLSGIGERSARAHSGAAPADAWLGLDGFAWGGERIAVTRLEVPADQVDKELRLVAETADQFTLFDAEGDRVLSGKVGVAAEHNGFAIFVAQLLARPGTGFVVKRRLGEDALKELIEKLVLSEKPRDSGMLRVALSGREPSRVAATVDAIVTAYVRQNVERRSAEAAKMLEFINTQLPVLKANLDEAEAKLNAHRATRGAVDLGLESQSALKQLVDVEQQLSEIAMQRTEQRQRFTDNHPVILALDKQERHLRSRQAIMKTRLRDLPEVEMEVLPLMRDVVVNRDLYVLLLNKGQELKVAKSGTIGNAHVIDRAFLPTAPVRPRPAVNLAIATLLGCVGGVGMAFARKRLNPVIDDPDVVEQTLGIPVYACVPHSNEQAVADKERKNRHADTAQLLALHAPNDLAVESLRSLRTSVQFALLESSNNVVAISGPTPGVGKTFVALNLAQIFADCGKSVLFIDADMRKGLVHRHLGISHAPGLADVIRGDIDLYGALRAVNPGVHEGGVIRLIGQRDAADGERGTSSSPQRAWDGLRVLVKGTVPPNPAELLASEHFRKLLSSASSLCDIVVIDTPPILAVTDGALIGRLVGVNLLVLHAGHHTLSEVAHVARRLAQDGARVRAAVFNNMPRRAGWYSRAKYPYYKYPSYYAGYGAEEPSQTQAVVSCEKRRSKRV